MLDTNTVSYLIKQHPAVVQHVLATPIASLCISSVTEGELLFGLANRPEAKRLHLVVREFLLRVETMPWVSATAECYGTMRADVMRQGKSLAPLDMLIAAHALSIDAVLVSSDQAFSQISNLQVQDWTVDRIAW